MSNPLDPAQDAAVRAGLAAQAAAVTGNPAAAGIYGDPAGAAAPSVPLDLSSATPANVSVEDLLARLNKLEAEREAERLANLPPEPEPLDLTPVVLGASVNAEVRSALQGLHDRLVAAGL